PNWRQVYRGLSRYYDINMLHDLAEAESGWDMTPRFDRKALNFLPIDLNCLLYKYETDFARAETIFGNKKAADEWLDKAAKRKQLIDELMWSESRDFYYDYNFVKEKRGGVSSLAGFFPLWAGMVDEARAAKLVKALRRFENKGGLATTDNQPLSQLIPGSIPTQWAYPNGWAPLHFMVIKGLQRYGSHDDAQRIAMKWLKTNLEWFNVHGVFIEKYNVVQPNKPPLKGVYPSQIGFGWTNAIFERLCREFIDN
ncbi:alpha,alpha-trehalase, partial [Candidatus Saccharibacteria bacterium]|nr:alpha,alpha-trehalase [Candidatus Saccharibacteria bacterium]